MFKIIQEEINLLVKQAQLVGKLEQQHSEKTILGDFSKANIIREQLNSIYPSYLELLKRYTTTK
jgi:hypothetical protein